MTTPTRLTPEDLPTLRKLAEFWEQRRHHDFARSGWFGTIVRKAVGGAYAIFARRAIAAIERAGHLASDERVDKHGRVSKL